MSIRVLSEETINKIAAGEVVENPASVVKELVENAVDAGSTSAVVEIKAGGFSLIRVTDDGQGMSRDDLLLSLERHATSKIRKASDLDEVHSMGFRGEALASIAAISKMRIVSCLENQMVGGALSCNGGKLSRVEDAARGKGTTIEVRALFYNVPARKKFQKTASASQVQILKVLTKLALAHPQLSVRCIADEKEMLWTHSGTLEKTCHEVLGSGFMKGTTSIDYEENLCSISGHLGSPLDARKNRLGQYLFVNGRGVVCPEISRGIYEAYGTRLSVQQHPTFVLHFTLPPSWIDVNVHPQKREIRLREEVVVKEVIRRGVLEAFQGKKEVVRDLPKIEPIDWNVPSSTLRFQEAPQTESSIDQYQPLHFELPVIGQFDHFLFVDGRVVQGQLELPNFPSPYNGMLIVDLEAAHARVLFERFLSSGVGALQALMVPHTLEFTPHESETLKLYLVELEKIGVEMRPFGDNCFIVEALAPEIEENSLKPFIDSLLEVFDQKIAEKELKKKLALTVSRYAKSQKKGWTVLEGKHLVKQLLKTDFPYECPKGKPTIIHFSHEAIEGFFQKTR